MSLRFMRMIIFYDLPTETLSQRRTFAKFVKQIKKIGFLSLQKSVYMKLCINASGVDSTKIELKKILPQEGNVALLVITEKQFSSIEYMLGEHETNVINSEDRIIEI